MDSDRIDLSVVQAWHDAVNEGAIDRLAELLDDDVEFGGPRGSGRGANVVLEWARHSGIHLEPLRWFRVNEAIVVEELATWRDPDTGEAGAPSDAATLFKVRNEQIRRAVRYDTLPAALAAADLAETDLVPAPPPTTADEMPVVTAAPPPVIARDALPLVAGSRELEGYLHGAPLSMIFVDAPPGSGPKLHRHPYAEVFIVQEGHVTFTVGEATFEVTSGQIAIAPPGVPHKFVNSGNGPLRQLDIHTNDRFETEWLEG